MVFFIYIYSKKTTPLLCELITVIDETIFRVYLNVLATNEVLWFVEHLFLQGHARVWGEDGFFGELLAVEHKRERVFARIVFAQFLYFNGVVCQEKV